MREERTHQLFKKKNDFTKSHVAFQIFQNNEKNIFKMWVMIQSPPLLLKRT